ncbi:MAG: tRNA N6-adenosine(37)-N6-threonylcarbamoyltransferase complex dimerization subunit TsaB, partial [Gemmatimonadetes bacterium]|nr:tRNA N6-adenosine(37)-N6-threonylcarbamoyltransferase complex dimerization subunit TsaB [Gemmatimonadota bacterium]
MPAVPSVEVARSAGLSPIDGPVLALDSSAGVGSVAVGDGDRLLGEAVLNVGPGASSALLPAIDAVLRTAGLAPADLRGVVVAGGPGSFTGLRIAAATAKGLVAALGVPMFAYSGLLAAAAGHWGAGRPVCALFDARRRDVYLACYRFPTSPPGEGGAPEDALEEMVAPTAMTVDEVVARFRGQVPPLFTGEAAAIHGAELARELGAPVVPALLAAPRAS